MLVLITFSRLCRGHALNLQRPCFSSLAIAYCWRMLTYADVCFRSFAIAYCWRMLTYAHVCFRSLAIAYCCLKRAGWGIPQAVYLRVGARNPWGTVWAPWFVFFFSSFSLFFSLFPLLSLFSLFTHTRTRSHTHYRKFLLMMMPVKKEIHSIFPLTSFLMKKRQVRA